MCILVVLVLWVCHRYNTNIQYSTHVHTKQHATLLHTNTHENHTHRITTPLPPPSTHTHTLMRPSYSCVLLASLNASFSATSAANFALYFSACVCVWCVCICVWGGECVCVSYSCAINTHTSHDTYTHTHIHPPHPLYLLIPLFLIHLVLDLPLCPC